MEKKLYYAYVAEDMIDYFETELERKKDKIEVIYRGPSISNKGEMVRYYVMEAYEGVIDPKWELK